MYLINQNPHEPTLCFQDLKAKINEKPPFWFFFCFRKLKKFLTNLLLELHMH